MTTGNSGKSKLGTTKAPALPFAPVQYDRTYQDSFNNILRQYFNQNDNLNNSLLADMGARYLDAPYASFISTTSQTAAVINTAYPITLSGIDGTTSNGVYIGSNTANVFPDSRIFAQHLGVYNLQFSLQLENTDSQIQDVSIWLRKNGSNEANSNTKLSVPNKHGSVNGAAVAAWNFFLEYTATTDYYELCWLTTSTAVSLPTTTAAAPAPGTPSVILTMQFVSRI
jgi:hypothetical protein